MDLPEYKPPSQPFSVLVSTFKFLLCFTTSRIMLPRAPFHPDRNPKESISLLSATFVIGSQFSGHFFRLHLLCRILLPIRSLAKKKKNNLFNGFCGLSIHFQDFTGDGHLYPTVSLGPASSISCQPSAQHTNLSIMTSPGHFYLLNRHLAFPVH